MRKIGFLGFDCTDVILYLAELLSAFGKQVSIIDCGNGSTVCGDFDLPVNNGMAEGYRNDVYICRGLEVPHETEYALYYFGSAMTHSKLCDCSDVVFVTDMVLTNAKKLSSAKITDDVSTICVLRNFIPVKYGVSAVIQAAGQNIPEDRVFALAHTETDYRAKCYIGTDFSVRYKYLSKEMRELLKNILILWEPSLDGKEFMRLVKKIR